MIGGLLALMALLARTPALSLPAFALTRRRLKKLSIYLLKKSTRVGHEGHANSADSANRSGFVGASVEKQSIAIKRECDHGEGDRPCLYRRKQVHIGKVPSECR
ncbi:hypothetical protein SAMN05428984_1682 [Sphingomonas sp. OK281]|nr:hypothetical protein SAMN05428984_1682 [Sphingomonas sp. OK281]